MTEGPNFPDDVTPRERAEWVNTIANMRLLTDANAETVEAFIGQARFRRRPAKDVLVRATDRAESVYFLVSGIVRVFQERSDLQYTPKILTAPTHFGELAALAGLDHHQSCLEALTDCVTAEVPLHLLEQRLSVDHEMCRAWLYSVSRQFSVTIDYLKQNIFGGVAARLANVLLSYADVFGEDLEDGWKSVGYELSYATLARQAACTRRAVINTMNAMQEADVARSTEAGWVIKPKMLLEELLPGRMSLSYSLDDSREPSQNDG